MGIIRYAKIPRHEQREIVLLKGKPCRWGRCSFCNYIEDNSRDVDKINQVNLSVLEKVTGEFHSLMVINSGSCFELPEKTIAQIIKLVKEKRIEKLFFEAHWMYRKHLDSFRQRFDCKVYFITGIETFDEDFRNRILKKGVDFKSIEEIQRYFQSICLMIGMKGQTRDMIKNDVEIAINNFDRVTFNLFIENGTEIKPDYRLQKWFEENYNWLQNKENVDILFNNTDFGVGALENE